MKSLKRVLLPIVFLGVCLLCACGEKKPEEAAPTATPTPLPEYKEYDYAEGKFTVTLPYEAEEPTKKEQYLEFTDPDGKWTMTLAPITAGQLSNRITELEYAQNAREGGAKQVKTEETTISGMNAIVFSSNLDEAKNGPDQTAVYLGSEEYAAILKYKDHYVGNWDGLKIEVKTTERFDDIYLSLIHI